MHDVRLLSIKHFTYVSFNLLLNVFACSGLDLAVGLQAAWQCLQQASREAPY